MKSKIFKLCLGIQRKYIFVSMISTKFQGGILPLNNFNQAKRFKFFLNIIFKHKNSAIKRDLDILVSNYVYFMIFFLFL